MTASSLQRASEWKWVLPQTGSMRVPGILYASDELAREIDSKVIEQLAGVASLPGIVCAAFAMPDAHCGYGFPIGGVAGFDATDGIVSAGGVGFDISCGVRTLLTGIASDEIVSKMEALADALFRAVPAGVGSTGRLRLNNREMDAMLQHGALWAVQKGHGFPEDMERIEHRGEVAGARPDLVSERARMRQQQQMGTLGSGNHYLEIQKITAVFDQAAADAMELREGEIVVSIHCGSRGLGHQVATEYSASMSSAARKYGIQPADRELACVPASCPEGEAYLGAMRAAMNCALANRQILTAIVRETIADIIGECRCPLLYDVSHNTCSLEEHAVEGKMKPLLVHRKGATRAFGPLHPELPDDLRQTGQPVLVGGSMGTPSFILRGCDGNEQLSFSSACHGAGRRMSRTQASKRWHGRDVVTTLEKNRILIRSRSLRGIAEEAPGAYKDVTSVVNATVNAGLARMVAELTPLVCIKG